MRNREFISVEQGNTSLEQGGLFDGAPMTGHSQEFSHPHCPFDGLTKDRVLSGDSERSGTKCLSPEAASPQ